MALENVLAQFVKRHEGLKPFSVCALALQPNSLYCSSRSLQSQLEFYRGTKHTLQGISYLRDPSPDHHLATRGAHSLLVVWPKRPGARITNTSLDLVVIKQYPTLPFSTAT